MAQRQKIELFDKTNLGHFQAVPFGFEIRRFEVSNRINKQKLIIQLHGPWPFLKAIVEGLLLCL
jgi:hypothetical protein